MSGAEEVDRRAWLVLGLASAGQMATTFASSALNVGFGVIETDLGVERTTLAWSISGYAIAAAALLLTAGRSADRLGGRRVFLAGIAIFGVGSVVCASAPGVEVLVAGRVIQGLASAALIPSSLTLALQAFPAQRRSLAIGVWGGIAAIAGSSGPPVGAALIELASWRSVFVILAVVSAGVFATGRTVLVDTQRVPERGRLDIWSGPLASIAVGLIIAVLLEGADWGWTGLRSTGALIGAAGLLATVVLRSRRHANPFEDRARFDDLDQRGVVRALGERRALARGDERSPGEQRRHEDRDRHDGVHDDGDDAVHSEASGRRPAGRSSSQLPPRIERG